MRLLGDANWWMPTWTRTMLRIPHAKSAPRIAAPPSPSPDCATERSPSQDRSRRAFADARSLDRDGLVVVGDRRPIAVDRRATVRTARGTLLLAAPAETAAPADAAAYVVDVENR